MRCQACGSTCGLSSVGDMCLCSVCAVKEVLALQEKQKDFVEILECLKWYIANDGVNEGAPGNEYYTDGLNRAREAVKRATLQR